MFQARRLLALPYKQYLLMIFDIRQIFFAVTQLHKLFNCFGGLQIDCKMVICTVLSALPKYFAFGIAPNSL